MLIGIHGKAGSGKSTLSILLAKQLGLHCYAFADPIKKGLSESLGIPLEHLYDESMKDIPNYKYGKSLRQLMQEFGGWLRSMRSNVLLDGADRFLAEHQGQGIITDVKPPKEAVFVRCREGVVVQVVSRRSALPIGEAEAPDMSEAELPQELIDFTIINDGSLDDLAAEAKFLAVKLQIRAGYCAETVA